jgi:hypothetical protein
MEDWVLVSVRALPELHIQSGNPFEVASIAGHELRAFSHANCGDSQVVRRHTDLLGPPLLEARRCRRQSWFLFSVAKTIRLFADFP